MKRKFVGIFLVFVLSVLTFLHSAFKEPSKESDLRLKDVEMLSSREGGSSGGCKPVSGWCFVSSGPQKGIRTL